MPTYENVKIRAQAVEDAEYVVSGQRPIPETRQQLLSQRTSTWLTRLITACACILPIWFGGVHPQIYL